MSSESEPPESRDDNESKTQTSALTAGAASEAAQIAIFASSGVPPELQKNAYQVISRLTTSMTEWVSSWIDNNRRERDAASEGRILITKAASERLAAKLEVSADYVRAAADKFAERIVQGRKNIDAITREAIEELGKLPPLTLAAAQAPPPPLDADWLNTFEVEAEQVSTEHGRKLFARILAGEISKPSTFSKKTLKLLSELDNQAAVLFSRVASIAISIDVIGDARVAGLGTIGDNSLAPFGLNYINCTTLQDYGLVIGDLAGWLDYRLSVWTDKEGRALPFSYAGQSWILRPTKLPAPTEMRVPGMKLTASGLELLKVVDVTPNEVYTDAIQKHFLSRGVEMVKVTWLNATQYEMPQQTSH